VGVLAVISNLYRLCQKGGEQKKLVEELRPGELATFAGYVKT